MNEAEGLTDADFPRCPACGYALVGIASRRCPECGLALRQDLSVYRLSRTQTPWSAIHPLPLWRGIWPVLRRPMATASSCADPQRVTWRRAIAFAALIAAFALLLWGPLREYAAAVQVLVRDWGDPNGIRDPFSFAWRELHHFHTSWYDASLWLGWAFTRWLVLFGVLAVALPGGRSTPQMPRSARLRALLLFVPWLFLLDLACSMTVWAAAGSCVPEPNTMWPWYAGEPSEMIRFWLIRLIVPVPLVGALFFRSVLGWRVWTSIASGLALLPAAAITWMLWDHFFLFHVIGGPLW